MFEIRDVIGSAKTSLRDDVSGAKNFIGEVNDLACSLDCVHYQFGASIRRRRSTYSENFLTVMRTA